MNLFRLKNGIYTNQKFIGCASFRVALVLACLATAPMAQAVVPAPDGGYPGGNTAEGKAALLSLTTGQFNTAVGFFSLRSNTTNNFNTAIGTGALLANTSDLNTAVGAGALLTNTFGTQNTASGAFALFSNTTGTTNAATGYQALFSNTTGIQNTATGDGTLLVNTIGNDNTATGFNALLRNTTGNDNTGNGVNALLVSTTGNSNTAVGFDALDSNTTGGNNIALGTNAGSTLTTGDDNIDIGNVGVAGESHIIRIGTSGVQSQIYVAGITGNIIPTGAPVFVGSDGGLGLGPSSARFKTAIKPIDKASEAILSLRPVTFHYKTDGENTPQFGLIAEEVAKVNPALVLPDKEGKPYTVRYDAVNAMLLNEFLKEHKAFVEEQRKVQELEANAARQQKQIDRLTTGLQKVSAQLELSKSARQTVVNNQ